MRNTEKNPKTVDLLYTVALAVRDEYPMVIGKTFGAVDRPLHEVRDRDKPFEEILAVYAGDFRQLLRVVR